MPPGLRTSPFSKITELPRRDILAISVSLAGIVALSWWYLFALSADMVMPMAALTPSDEVMAAMIVPAWNTTYFATMFLMWSTMMVGMMLPSVAPTVLIYSLVEKKAAREGTKIARTSAFLSGYILVWVGFSFLATTSQYLLDQASLLTAMMASKNKVLGGSLLLIAGTWQFAPWKDQCLQHCRSPFDFISRNWKKGKLGAARMGVKHGIVCLGCCWAIMTLLFLGGVMNLLWIAILSVFVFLEKILPGAEKSRKFTGALLVIAGLIVLL